MILSDAGNATWRKLLKKGCCDAATPVRKCSPSHSSLKEIVPVETASRSTMLSGGRF
jgi:hypothetical protein